MRAATRALGLVLVAGLVVASVPSAWAGSLEGGDPTTVITTNPRARGTVFPGTLAVYLQVLGNPFLRAAPDVPAPCLVAEVNMSFFIRVVTKTTALGFSGLEQSNQQQPFCAEDFPRQEATIRAAIQKQVVPALGGATFEIKSATNFVQDDQNDHPGSLFFYMLNFDLAIE